MNKNFRISIWFPEEMKLIWKQVKAQASLEGKSIGNWILDLIKKELKLS